MSSPPRFVRVAYLDHMEFKDCKDPSHEKPVRCEAYGLLVVEDPEYLQLMWLVGSLDEPTHQGLVIVRSCVLEVEEFEPKEG